MARGAARAAKHLGIYSFGAIARQVIGFLMLPIYTRYLAPADYGAVAMLTLLVSIFELVLGARFASAIPKFYYERDSLHARGTVIGTALAVTTVVSSFGALLIALGSRPLAEVFLADASMWHYVALYGVTLITVAIESYALVFIRLQDRPWLFMVASLAKLLVSLSLNIYLVVFLRLGVAGVVFSTVLSSAGFGLILGGYTLYQTRGWRIDRQLVKRLIGFSWPLWVGSLAAVYIGFANRFLIRYFGDLADVGLYDLAARFSSLILILVWQPFNQWWQTERFNQLRRADRGRPVFRSVYSLITAAMVVMAVGISLFADIVIRIMATSSFHSAAEAVPPLAFAAVLQQLALFNNVSFLASERTGLIAVLKYCSAALLTVLYIVSIPILGFLGAAYATLGAAVVMWVLTLALARRTYDISTRLNPSLLIVTFGAVIIAADTLFAHQSLWLDFLQKCLLAALLITLVLLVLSRDSSTREELEKLRSLIFSKLRIRVGR